MLKSVLDNPNKLFYSGINRYSMKNEILSFVINVILHDGIRWTTRLSYPILAFNIVILENITDDSKMASW